MADQKRAASYTGKELLHAAFDLDFLKKPFRPGPFYKAIQHWDQVLEDKTWPNYVLNNHDERRSATRYTRGEKDDRLFVLAAMLLTLRGTPYLYYGEEIGMRDIPVKTKSRCAGSDGKTILAVF